MSTQATSDRRRACCVRRGFTLVELLIVVIVIGVAIGMLIPAVQSAREAARRAQCTDNFKQLGLACLNHESARTHWPSGGWGYNWLGDPDRHADFRQPGGWIYSILPYIEQKPLYELSAGKTGADAAANLQQLVQTPHCVFICPSRRMLKTYPFTRKPEANGGAASFYRAGLYCDASGKSLLAVAKTDYAGNGGSHYFTADTLPGDKMCDAGGPIALLTPEAADPYALFDAAFNNDRPIADAAGRWTLTPKQGIEKFAAAADGIFYPFSAVTMKEITDGMSNTYLCGEKALAAEHFSDGLDDGDNQCAYMGYDNDIIRWAESSTTGTLAGPLRDPRKSGPADLSGRFGGPHVGGFNAAFCDGSVHTTGYQVDPVVHGHLANRKDGVSIDPYALSH